jgi:PAS domain-containing protein
VTTPSPGPSAPPVGGGPNLSAYNGPVLLVAVDGRCVYASKALTKMLQCSPHELLGHAWRERISPFALKPFNAEHAIQLAHRGIPIRLRHPDGDTEIVSRISVVTDPSDPSRVTGFLGRVQVVRVHQQQTSAGGTA